MPAFVLLAREERAFWSNVMTFTEYLIDILSITGGLGIFLKVERFAMAVNSGNSVLMEGIKQGAMHAIATIYITSGVGRGLLKLTETRDTPLGRAISEVLFYLEMAAIVGYVGVGVHTFIQRSAQKALTYTDDIEKIYREVDELTKKNTDKFDHVTKTDELVAAEERLAAVKKLEEIAGGTGAQTAVQHLDNIVQLRKKFHNKELVKELWELNVVRKLLFKNNLKKMYYKYLDQFPNLQNGFNQAEFTTKVFKNGKQIDEILEYSISGNKQKLIQSFGDPPKMPPNTINIIDDYFEFSKFVEGAVDFGGRPRLWDSEIKFIFNFVNKHINKGDSFIIETRNIFKTCDSCRRELLILQEYLKSQGKRLDIVVFSDDSIESTRDLLNAINS